MLIFRFLQVATLAYLYSLLTDMVCSLSLNLDGEAAAALLHHSRHLRRSYKLYSKCSGQHLQIVGKHANARGDANSSNAELVFVSVHTRHHPNALSIVGRKSGRYLCFNKKGKLIARFNGKKKLCLFREDFSEHHYTVLRSVHNPMWYVGFDRRGRPLKGNAHLDKPRLLPCTHFVKRDHNYGLQRAEVGRPGPVIKDPSRLKDLLTGGRRSRPLRTVAPIR